MLLLIDWGNSFFKFALIDSLNAESPAQGFCQASQDIEHYITPGDIQRVIDLEQLKHALPESIDLVLVASVKSEEDNHQLKTLLESFNCSVFFAQTAKQACGITCAYEKPSTLGIDRWLGVIAASSGIEQAIGVISFGTAITLDVVSNQQHLGGHIIPNKHLMLQSLNMTARVRADLKTARTSKRGSTAVLGQSASLGQSTNDCVNLGIDKAIAGYLNTIIDEIKRQHSVEKWVITGGGSDLIQSLLPNGVKIDRRPMLIFEGLLRLYSGLSKDL